jgi:uncharacterized protein
MRIVALEEHFVLPDVTTAPFAVHPNPAVAAVQNPGKSSPERLAELTDLGDGRIAAMDEAGITVQVLSASLAGADLLDGDEGIAYAVRTNDVLAAAIAGHPDRFAGFAHLPLRTPDAAADELERAVSTLGFRGAMLNGTTQGLFLDDPRFDPVLARAAKLGVPVYIHPNVPPPAVYDAYYASLPGRAGPLLATAGFGWHVETGLHVLRLAAAGVFDRHPGLVVVIGHQGEGLPSVVERASESLHRAGIVSRPLQEIFREQLFVTTSAFFTHAPFHAAREVFGIERLLFGVDYPFASNNRGRAFLDSLDLTHEDLEKLAHGNADALLGLQP